jgi:hypothetical protein
MGENPMGRNNVSARENAVHSAQVLKEIGRRLKDEYDIAQPLPDRLTDLLGQIEGLPEDSKKTTRHSGRASAL